MEKFLEQAYLYDFYGELLTEHQKQIYGDFVLNDLSLSEIAEEQGISRQGVHDLVRRCDKILKEYEDKLHLVEKFLFIKKQILEMQQIMGSMEACEEPEKLVRLRQISGEILEEL